MNLMSREIALGFLRSGKNGHEILQILESIVADLNNEETETTEETEI